MSIRGGPGRLLRSSRADGRCVSGRCVSGRCEPGAVRFNFLEAKTVTYRPTALKQYDLEVGRVAVTSVPPGGPEAQTQVSSMRAARPILPWANLRRRLSVPNPETAGSGSPACEIWACWRLRGVARKDSPVRPIPSELPRRRDHCKTHSGHVGASVASRGRTHQSVQFRANCLGAETIAKRIVMIVNEFWPVSLFRMEVFLKTVEGATQPLIVGCSRAIRRPGEHPELVLNLGLSRCEFERAVEDGKRAVGETRWPAESAFESEWGIAQLFNVGTVAGCVEQLLHLPLALRIQSQRREEVVCLEARETIDSPVPMPTRNLLQQPISLRRRQHTL